MKTRYSVVAKAPVAKFYYKGTHSHPVRRTILVIEDKNNLLIGYELREGKEERSINKAPIKSYRKDRIANFGDYSRLKMSKKNYKRKDQDSTLLRETLQEALLSGV